MSGRTNGPAFPSDPNAPTRPKALRQRPLVGPAYSLRSRHSPQIGKLQRSARRDARWLRESRSQFRPSGETLAQPDDPGAQLELVALEFGFCLPERAGTRATLNETGGSTTSQHVSGGERSPSRPPNGSGGTTAAPPPPRHHTTQQKSPSNLGIPRRRSGRTRPRPVSCRIRVSRLDWLVLLFGCGCVRSGSELDQSASASNSVLRDADHSLIAQTRYRSQSFPGHRYRCIRTAAERSCH